MDQANLDERSVEEKPFQGLHSFLRTFENGRRVLKAVGVDGRTIESADAKTWTKE